MYHFWSADREYLLNSKKSVYSVQYLKKQEIIEKKNRVKMAMISFSSEMKLNLLCYILPMENEINKTSIWELIGFKVNL